MDYLTILLSNPQYIFILILWASGYYFFRLFYRGSKHWRGLNSTERWILGGCLGAWIVFVGMPFLDTLFYVAFHIHLDGTTLALLSSAVLGFAALMFWVNGILGLQVEQSLRQFLTYCIAISVISICLMLAISVIEYQTQYYPASTLDIIGEYWKGFRQAGLLLTSLSIAPLYVLFLRPRLIDQKQHIPILRFPGSKPSQHLISHQIHGIWNSRTFRYSLVSVIVVLAVSFLIVPVDMQWHVFTPGVIVGREGFYAGQGCNDTYADLMMIRTYEGNYKFYQEMEMRYHVTLPRLYRFDTFVSIANPSNFSTNVRGTSYADPWSYISSNGPANVSFSYTMSDGKVTRIIANLTSARNSTAEFTLLYYNEFLKRSVVYSESDNFTRIDNMTVLMRHSFLITNLEKICVAVPRIQYDRLNYEGVNASLARVYVNGQLQIGMPVDRSSFYPWTIVNPDTTANITIVFPMKTP
jgi:hypothetical protein